MGHRGGSREGKPALALACLGSLALGGLILGGCAHDEGLVPAPGAARVPGSTRVAYQQAEGVVVFVDGDAWRGEPRDLETVIAPLWVTVQNQGQRSIRLMYRDFGLTLPSGVRVTPLSPFAMRAPGPMRTAAIHQPAFYYHRFFVAPYYRPYYPGLRPWHRAFPHDPFVHTTYARWRVALPTEDMLRMAMPEGVLEPGGSVSGFLYFPDIPRKAQGTFTFRVNLAEEDDGKAFAQVDIPLQPK